MHHIQLGHATNTQLADACQQPSHACRSLWQATCHSIMRHEQCTRSAAKTAPSHKRKQRLVYKVGLFAKMQLQCAHRQLHY